jgi:hypothetical protein
MRSAHRGGDAPRRRAFEFWVLSFGAASQTQINLPHTKVTEVTKGVKTVFKVILGCSMGLRRDTVEN